MISRRGERVSPKDVREAKKNSEGGRKEESLRDREKRAFIVREAEQTPSDLDREGRFARSGGEESWLSHAHTTARSV